MTTPSFRDVELLSAYLDGALSPSDSARLDSRLKSDPQLRAVMDDLRATRVVLRKLPQRKAPRNFMLTPGMVGFKPPMPRAYPMLRFASALATLLLFFTFAVNLFSTPISFGAQAPAAEPYGAGGGDGIPEEAFATEPLNELQPLPTPEAADATRIADETPTPEPTLKAIPDEQADRDSSRPIPFAWQLSLLIAALALGGMAWVVRLMNDQKWHARK